MQRLAFLLMAAAAAWQLPSMTARRPTLLRAETEAALAQGRTDALIKELADTEVFNLPAKVRQETILRQVGRPQFFLRIAELCDDADEEEREKLTALADNLAKTLTVVVESAEQKIDDSSAILQEVVASCAEPDGEFLVPLSEERFSSLQKAVWTKMEAGELGEIALSTVDAWAKKAQDDGLDGMVSILRKVLQLYASRVLRFDAALARAAARGDDAARRRGEGRFERRRAGVAPRLRRRRGPYEELLAGDADAWPRLLSEPAERRRRREEAQRPGHRPGPDPSASFYCRRTGPFPSACPRSSCGSCRAQVEKNAPASEDDAFDAAAFVREQVLGDDAYYGFLSLAKRWRISPSIDLVEGARAAARARALTPRLEGLETP